MIGATAVLTMGGAHEAGLLTPAGIAGGIFATGNMRRAADWKNIRAAQS